MNYPSTSPLQPGEPAPNGLLPNGTPLSALQGQPVVLAFAPDEWNPGHAHQSALFAGLLRDFDGEVAFVDTAGDTWHSLDWRGTLAEQFGVAGQRALFLLDEQGVVRWQAVVEANAEIRPGQLLAVLEELKSPPIPTSDAPSVSSVSRRTFVTALLATVALLLLPDTDAAA